jgi:hypothetical protein
MEDNFVDANASKVKYLGRCFDMLPNRVTTNLVCNQRVAGLNPAAGCLLANLSR